MTTVAIVSAILTLLAGIGVFLVACSMMSSNLESLSSDKLKNLFAKASGSKLLGVGIGTLGTAAIQSSGATTVMVIGFVSAGLMSLKQGISVIFGANIGTTMTAQIIAFKISDYIYLFIFVGFIIYFVAKKQKVKNLKMNKTRDFSFIMKKLSTVPIPKIPLIGDINSFLTICL